MLNNTVCINSLRKDVCWLIVSEFSVITAWGGMVDGFTAGRPEGREAGRQRVTIGVGTRHKLQEHASRALLLAKPYSVKCSECPQNGTTN